MCIRDRRHADATQGYGKAGLAAGQIVFHVRLVQGRQQFRRAQRIGQRHDGDVQRFLQRLADADGAAILPVKILRFVACLLYTSRCV